MAPSSRCVRVWWAWQAAVTAFPCHAPSSLPTPCISQLDSRACQELRHTALSDKWPYCTQSYSSYLQLSQPSTLQARPKPVVAFIPTFGKYSRVKCHHLHSPKKMCHLESVSCLPFSTNARCKCQARSLIMLPSRS